MAAEETLKRALSVFPEEQLAIQTQLAALGGRIEETRARFSLG
jgi:hypothetical protein